MKQIALTDAQISEVRQHIKEARNPKNQIYIEAQLLGIDYAVLMRQLDDETLRLAGCTRPAPADAGDKAAEIAESSEKRKRRHITEQDRQEVLRLHGEGKTGYDIAGLLDISRPVVSRIINGSKPAPEAEAAPKAERIDVVIRANAKDTEGGNVAAKVWEIHDAYSKLDSAFCLCREIGILSDAQEDAIGAALLMLSTYAMAFEAGVNFAGGGQ